MARGVDAGLGGEGRLADVGRLAVGRAVEDLVQQPAGVRQLAQPLRRHAGLVAIGELALEQQRRDDGGEVGVAAALAEAVERALDLARAGPHRHQRVGHRVLGVVVRVDAEMRARHVLVDVRDDGGDLVRQRAAVGVAQHHPARARLVGRSGHRQRIGAVGLVAVEEMLAVDHRLAVGLHDRLDRLRDAFEVLLVADAERHAHVIVPRLGDQADGPRMRLQRRLEARIVGDRAPRALGHAEGGEGGVDEARIGLEELRIGDVGAGIAALDVVDADVVERAGDQPLVLEREVHARRLRAVAQGCIEQVEAFAGHALAFFKNGSTAARNRSASPSIARAAASFAADVVIVGHPPGMAQPAEEGRPKAGSSPRSCTRCFSKRRTMVPCPLDCCKAGTHARQRSARRAEHRVVGAVGGAVPIARVRQQLRRPGGGLRLGPQVDCRVRRRSFRCGFVCAACRIACEAAPCDLDAVDGRLPPRGRTRLGLTGVSSTLSSADVMAHFQCLVRLTDTRETVPQSKPPPAARRS